jgi:hypothetical protein
MTSAVMVVDGYLTPLSESLEFYLELCAKVMTAIITVMIAVDTSLGD